MNPRRLLIFLVVLVGLFGCKRSSSGQIVPNVPAIVAAVVLGGGDILLNPLATSAVLVGLVTLRNETAAGTANGDIRYRVDVPSGYQASQAEVTLAPGEEVVLQIFTTLVLAAVLTVDVFARYVAGTEERAFPIAWNNLCANSTAFLLLGILSQPVFAVAWYASILLDPIGVLTGQSNPLVPQRIPQLAQDVRLFGAILGFLSLVQLTALFGGLDEPDGAPFPEGEGPNGLTLAADPSVPLAEGDYVTFWFSVAGDIPRQGSELLTYAIVVDSDVSPANNWVPAPAFPDDFYKDTDRWYQLNYDPNTGWRFDVTQVSAGNGTAVVPSAARAIINGDTIVVLVPKSEFAVDKPPFRVTTFAHTGDFGQNPPFTWSGDPTPAVAEGLQSWQ